MTNTIQQRRVLLVDSNDVARNELRSNLVAADLHFFEAKSLAGALKTTRKHAPELVLSELELADGSGFALARALRDDDRLSRKPIVLLISRWSNELDRILCFESGADDFISRPFFQRELASRVRALLRRGAHTAEPGRDVEPSFDEGLSIDRERHAIWVGRELVGLTPSEMSTMTALLRKQGHVVSRQQLLRESGEDAENTSHRNVDARIRSLRHKLGPARNRIQTVRGRGYRISGVVVPAKRDDQQTLAAHHSPGSRRGGRRPTSRSNPVKP